MCFKSNRAFGFELLSKSFGFGYLYVCIKYRISFFNQFKERFLRFSALGKMKAQRFFFLLNIKVQSTI